MIGVSLFRANLPTGTSNHQWTGSPDGPSATIIATAVHSGSLPLLLIADARWSREIGRILYHGWQRVGCEGTGPTLGASMHHPGWRSAHWPRVTMTDLG